MPTLKQQFGKRIKQLRRYKNLTQEQLAETCSLSADTISLIERGINAASFETLEKLANSLQVAVSDLFYFDEIST